VDGILQIRWSPCSGFTGRHAPDYAGYHCKACGYLTTVDQEACPACGGAFEKLPDAVEHAVMDVMKSGGMIEVVHDGRALEGAGRIGAILRY
jgi:predicted nucleic acid-binding Zn ribbon protein